MSFRRRPFTDEDQARIREAADLGVHSLAGFGWRDVAGGEREYYLELLQDELVRLRRLLDNPDADKRGVWVSRDHLTVACGLLEELAARLEPPSAPITEATIGLSKLAQEVAEHYRSLGATIARPQRSVEAVDVGVHMLSGVAFGSGTTPPALEEQVSFARVLFTRNDRRHGGGVRFGVIILTTSLLLELQGRLSPPSAPTTSGTRALRKLIAEFSTEFDDHLYRPMSEER